MKMKNRGGKTSNQVTCLKVKGNVSSIIKKILAIFCSHLAAQTRSNQKLANGIS